MTSAPVRDPLADHLLTPKTRRSCSSTTSPHSWLRSCSMDHALLMKNAVSTRSGAPAALSVTSGSARRRSRRDGHLTARSEGTPPPVARAGGTVRPALLKREASGAPAR